MVSPTNYIWLKVHTHSRNFFMFSDQKITLLELLMNEEKYLLRKESAFPVVNRLKAGQTFLESTHYGYHML